MILLIKWLEISIVLVYPTDSKIQNLKKGGAIMGNYEIKVNIEIVESKNSTTNKPNRTEDGCFKLTICGQDAINIDKCENALLKTNYEAIRDALSRHLQEISKKKPLKQ